MSAQGTKPITIKLPATLSTDDASSLRAYMVDGAGALVASAPFDGPTARLPAAGTAVKSPRVFIGPSFPENVPETKIDAFALAQIGAYQIPAGGGEVTVQNLPPHLILPPPLHFCNVQGNVTNALTVGGLTQSGPVCKAKVHIETVDWYWRRPVWLRPVVPLAIIEQLQALITVRRTQPKHMTTAAPKRLPVAVEDQILAADQSNIHEVVAINAEVIYPFICYYPIFWPWFYRITEQAVVYTDCNGHFDAWLQQFGTGAENIYVWVEASINGSWVTVYNPPFPCHTLWNYACGTEINISLANAAIPPCNCDTGVIDGTVWFTAIGNSAIASSIQQDITSTALTIPNAGCTNIFDANQLSPFGSTLALGLAAGTSLPATHYLWSWTMLDASGNPTGATTPITGAISRYYLWQLPDGSWEPGAVPLQDSDSDGNIAYILPNEDITVYTSNNNAQWDSFNFISAYLDSTKIPSGSVIQLSLQLLNLEGGVFTPVLVPPTTFQVSNSTNTGTGYGGSSPAPSNYLAFSGADASAFTLVVRVDNSKVIATINDAWLLDSSGNPVPFGNSGPCGFIEFTSSTPNVSLSFVASEAFNYATFSYTLYKGSSGPIGSAAGYVFENAPFSLTTSDSFTLAGGTYSDKPTILALLSGCTQAAFSQNLSVASLATDGSSVLATSIGAPYAASQVTAFALTPAAA
jgi:hypothetical protein